MHDSSAASELQVRSSTNPKQATADDERRMQEILANPEIKDILLDPRVQMLIETLRTDPDKAQRLTKAKFSMQSDAMLYCSNFHNLCFMLQST